MQGGSPFEDKGPGGWGRGPGVRSEYGGAWPSKAKGPIVSLIPLHSVMHVLRPNRVVAYTPFRDQSLLVNGPINSSIGSPLA